MDLNVPRPQPTPTSQRFWDALRQHRLEMQHCTPCDAYFFYPRAACPRCWSRDFTWRGLSGEGVLHTFTVTRVPTAPHFRAEVPQLIAVVELPEGPRLTSTLVGIEPEAVEVGMRVVPVFDDLDDVPLTLLRYAPG